MLAAIAWRNVWRNARRSLITMTALTLGVGGIVGIQSYREQVYGVLVRDITSGLVGHLQVHAQGYQEAPAIGLLVKNAVQVEAVVHGAIPGATTERRVIGAGLAGAGDRSAPVMVLGLQPPAPGGRLRSGLSAGHEAQPGMPSLYRLERGKELGAPREVLVGRELAADLGVSPGGELVLVSQAADGSTANDRYTVAGTFTSSSAELDAAALAMRLDDAQDFFALGEGVHQLVVRLPTAAEDVSPQAAALRSALDVSTLEALTWSEMLPEMKESMDTKRKSQWVMDFVIFLIVGLGVFNAMTMSVFERTAELGVLASLGTRPGRLLSMVLLESLWQAALAFVVGVGLATAVLHLMGSVDLSSMMQGDVMGARLPSDVKLALDPGSLTGAGLTALFTALVGGLLPAVRAARLKPVEALRHV